MSLFLENKECKACVVLYHGKTIITHHEPSSQTLSLPIVPVMRHHLSTILSEDEEDEIVIAINDKIVNIELNPILASFAYAAIENITKRQYKIKSMTYIGDGVGMFDNGIIPIRQEIFAIEVDHVDEMKVGISIDKIFCKLDNGSNNVMNMYYNGLKLEAMTSIVLTKYWGLRMAC